MSKFLEGLRNIINDFKIARRGAVAVMFALMMIPLLLATGAAVDFARVEILKTSLQSVVDSAAIAGASALNLSTGSTSAIIIATDYFSKGTALISSNAVISSPAVSEPSTIEVTVAATATLKYTFMSLVSTGTTIAVTASAEGPAYQLSVTKKSGFSSSSYDSDSVYFYDASTNSTPTVSSMTLLFTNDASVGSTSTTTKLVGVSANDYVGFALVNKTGGITAYGTNGYGSKQGTTQIFYSSLAVPSSLAYSVSSQGSFYTGSTSTRNNNTICTKTAITTTTSNYIAVSTDSCKAHPCTTLYNSSVLENNLLIGGSCSTQSTATQTCLSLYNSPITFSWNDMGGGSDDYDYNDAVYTVSCNPTTSTANQPAAVILVQ